MFIDSALPFRSTRFSKSFVDASTICWQICKSVQNLSFSDDGVNQIRVSIELVLNDVIEHFQEEEDKMMV